MNKNVFFPEVNGKFGFGCMRLPMAGEKVDLEQMTQMVDYFLEKGFNYFDTAHGYLGGESETALRECLAKRYPRDRYILTNKLSSNFFEQESDIRPLFQEQLNACGVQYFDFYLMHAQNAVNFEKYKKCRAYETALELKAEGKVRHVGLSFHDKANVLETILTEYPQIETVQIQFNYLDYEDESVESRKVYEVCEKFNKPVLVMEPVKGGTLVNLPKEAQQVLDDLQRNCETKKSNASYAVRFAASFPNIAVVLSGMSDMAQMADNTETMEDFKPLDGTEMEAIGQLRAVIRTLGIPCTSCSYCILDNHCPKNIRIPKLFSCYNMKTVFQNTYQDNRYRDLTQDSGKASDCIRCGKCEKICPQHLPIRKLLQTVAAEFER